MRVQSPVAGFLLVVFTLSACDGGPSPAGTYELDRQALVQLLQQQAKGLGAAAMQKMAEAAGGTIELRTDGTASMEMTFGLSTKGTGTWRRSGDGVDLVIRDAIGKEHRLQCGYNGKALALAEKGPGGSALQIVWNRK